MGHEIIVRVAGGKGVANTYLPACNKSQVVATDRSLKLAERCELVWKQRSQKKGTKVASSCEPTLTSPSEKNPAPLAPTSPAAHLGRLGEVIRLTVKGDDAYVRSWFSKAVIVEETSSKIVIGLPSKFTCSRIIGDLGHQFALWCQALGKEEFEILDLSSGKRYIT
jgi:hypothetical protein